MKQNHIRVLQILTDCRGPISRSEIGRRIGGPNWNGRPLSFYASAAVGYNDPTKRAAFEAGQAGGQKGPSLITLGYVTSREIEVDGITEDAVMITLAGRQALAALGDIDLPPLNPTRKTGASEID